MPYRLHIIVFALLILPTWLAAQGIRGYIRDSAGNPLEFATIYVPETSSGTVANAAGYYEIRLDAGRYNLSYQFMGYTGQNQQVTITGKSWQTLNITLASEVLELQTVEVTAKEENPANTVMRRAIAKAEFHQQQVDYYSAQVYIKGSGRILKVPRLVKGLIQEEGEVLIDSTVAYTSESVSLIEYERPNTYKERVISVFSQGEDNGSSPMEFINGSFYEPEIAQVISPLSPRAFAYYNFALEGYFLDRGYYVNKVKVTPKSRGDNVFEGFIYIVEDLWSIHSLDLTTYKLGIKINVRQVYAPILQQVWLPVTARFLVTGRVFGFGFEYTYLAAISDYEVRVNPNLNVEFKLIDERIEKEKAREAEQARKENPDMALLEEKLNTGEEITRRDLRKLMRDYEKQDAATESTPDSLAGISINKSYSVDTLAAKRDTVYWADVRPVPLTPFEVRGYRVLDSLAQSGKNETEDDEFGSDSGKNRKNSFMSLGELITGTDFKLGENKYLNYGGIANAGFNPVEGYWLQSRLAYTNNSSKKTPWELGFTPRYGFAWNRLVWLADAKIRTGKSNYRHSFYLAGGRFVSQYNAPNGVEEIFNTFYALLGERNYVQLFEKKYGQITWEKDWFEDATLNVRTEWAERRHNLQNETMRALINSDKRSFAPNYPAVLEQPERTADSVLVRAATVGVSLTWKPWQRYGLNNGNKYAINESSPSFTLDFVGGFPNIANSQSDFQRLGLVYRHTIRPGARGKLDIKLDMGLFLNDNFVDLPDFRHFAGNQMIFTTLDPVGAFRLLPYYTFSTRQHWLAGHVHYQFRKFLLTQIWEVQMLGAKENVFVNYLQTPESQHYTEVGYGIDNILRFLRLEGIVAFQDGRYTDWGIRIGIASNLLGGFGTVTVD